MLKTLDKSDKIWNNTKQLYNLSFKVSKIVRDIKLNIIAMHRSMKDFTLATNKI